MITKATMPHLRMLVMTAVLAAIWCVSAQAKIIVNSPADGVVRVPACTTPPSSPGDCTLREAIEEANASPGLDTIDFADRYEIQLSAPVTEATGPFVIDARTNGTRVSGLYDCSTQSAESYAINLLSPDAVGLTLRGLPLFNVCNRAIKSPVGSPSFLRIGPRRTDGTLPVTGGADGSVDLFQAPDVTSLEGSQYIGSATPAGGSFAVNLSPEPGAGSPLTATQTTAAGTSNFAPPFLVPFDVASPQFNGAFATSLTRVRVDFSEPVAVGSLAVADFQLSMAGTPRTVATVEPSGSSVFLNADPVAPWNYGDAGAISLAAAGAVTDLAGNEISGAPSGRVYGGPGDFGAPVISEYVVSPRTFCTRKGYGCRATKVRVKFNLSEAATVTFDVVKYKPGSRSRARFRDRLPIGRQSRPLSYKVSGKVIRPGRYFLMAYALDRSRNKSEQVGAFFEIKSPKPKPKPKKKKKKK